MATVVMMAPSKAKEPLEALSEGQWATAMMMTVATASTAVAMTVASSSVPAMTAV